MIRFGGNYTVNPMDISPPADAEQENGDDTYALTIRSVIEMLHTTSTSVTACPPARRAFSFRPPITP
ncbi:hypothetical protein, partial [Haloplanus litoreus]